MENKKQVNIIVSGEAMTGKNTLIALISEILTNNQIENNIEDDIDFQDVNHLKKNVKKDLYERLAHVSKNIIVSLKTEQVRCNH